MLEPLNSLTKFPRVRFIFSRILSLPTEKATLSAEARYPHHPFPA